MLVPGRQSWVWDRLGWERAVVSSVTAFCSVGAQPERGRQARVVGASVPALGVRPVPHLSGSLAEVAGSGRLMRAGRGASVAARRGQRLIFSSRRADVPPLHRGRLSGPQRAGGL